MQVSNEGRLKPRARARLSIIVMSVVGCTVGVERAAESGTPTSTIESLVAETVANNPELKFYEAEIAAAHAGRKSAGLLANPELGAEVGRKSATALSGVALGDGPA